MKDLWTTYEDFLLANGITKRRRDKLKTMFNIISRDLELKTAARKQIEEYLNKVNRNIIKKQRGGDFTGNTKRDIKKFLRQFFKWYKGENEFYPKEVSWIKTKIAKDEKPKERPVIELKDVPKLAKMFKRYDYQMLTLLLFDSGFRIQEMLSVKKKDLTWAEFDEGKKCFWIKCNVSKTFPRNVPIPLFTEDINSYFNSMDYRAKEDGDLLFDVQYEDYLKMLKIYSLKLIKRKLTPHCLRHSSATYYAKEYSGNVPLLAQRYGWEFDAKELKVYVRTSGAYNKTGAKISYKNEISKLKEENQKLWEEIENIKKVIQKNLITEIKSKK